MTKATKPRTRAAFCADGQPHHWGIASPNGPTSEGTCKKCGTSKAHRNSIDDSMTWAEISAARGS